MKCFWYLLPIWSQNEFIISKHMYIAINEFTNLETKKQSIKIIFVQRNNLIIYVNQRKKKYFFKSH